MAICDSTYLSPLPRVHWQRNDTIPPSHPMARRSKLGALKVKNTVLLNFGRLPEDWSNGRVFTFGQPFGQPGPEKTLKILGVDQLSLILTEICNRDYTVRLARIYPSENSIMAKYKRLFLRHLGYNCVRYRKDSFSLNGIIIKNNEDFRFHLGDQESLIGIVRVD